VADDTRFLEALDARADALAQAGRIGDAVAVLGEVARRCRQRGDAMGEARAVQRAGQRLCEAADPDPAIGIVMLLHAAELAEPEDDMFSDLVRNYVAGYQYTLTDAQFAALEPLLEREPAEVVAEAFARYRASAAGDSQ
jgi:hypothetical protein